MYLIQVINEICGKKRQRNSKFKTVSGYRRMDNSKLRDLPVSCVTNSSSSKKLRHSTRRDASRLYQRATATGRHATNNNNEIYRVQLRVQPF